jgi:hypothetical protein
LALSQKHRAALFERFLPSLGDELTDAFLAEFPLHEGDELVTRAYFEAEMATFRAEVRAEMAELRADLLARMAELRAELLAQMADLRTEVFGELAGVRTEMAELRTEMAELRTDLHREAAATNRRITTVALGVAGVLIAAGSAMTTVIVVALG